MADKTLPIGPWPKGINNVDDPKSAGFQPSEQNLPLLTKAQNIDLDRNGWVRRRVGRTKRLDLTSAHSLYVDSRDRMFLVDDGTLYEVFSDYGLREVDTGLSDRPVSYAEVAGQVFYANESKVGAIDSFWGIRMPSSPFALPAIAGILQPGRYLVAITAVRDGVESGARQPTAVSLSKPGGLTLSFVNVDPNADAIRVYCSDPNGQELYWAGDFAPSSPIELKSYRESQDPLTTFNHYPPLPGQHIASFRGRMLIAADRTLYWSQPLAYHHFRIQTDAQLFPDRISLLGVFDSGFFVAAGDRTYWVSGTEPDDWTPRVVDIRRVAEGEPLRVPAQKLPSLQGQGEVLVWATEDGFVAGLPDGSVRHLTDGRLAIDAYKQSALAYREQSGLRQILLNLQTKASDSLFGATDKMEAKVIRANEAIGEP